MSQSARPQLVAPRRAQTLEMVRAVSAGGGFDADAWAVMNERDNALIADEVLHGPGSSSFVYSFQMAGQRDPVAGISVIGARHLANNYRGLRHRLVAAMQKTGSLFVFTSYPSADQPMAVTASIVPELEAEEDFYSAIVEMVDVKSGNSIQVERREPRFGERQDGGQFERPHYATIAQSKAYRNAVLTLVPQDVVIRWRMEMLKLKKDEVITESVLEQKRSNVLQFAAQKAIALDRQAIAELTLDQIAGMGDAAREGALPAFVAAAQALGLEVSQGSTEEPAAAAAPGPPQMREPRRGQRQPPPRQAAPAAPQATAAATPVDGPPLPGEPATEAPKSDAPPAARRQVKFDM